MTPQEAKIVALQLLSTDVFASQQVKDDLAKCDDKRYQEFCRDRKWVLEDETSQDIHQQNERKWHGPDFHVPSIQWDVCISFENRDAILEALEAIFKEIGLESVDRKDYFIRNKTHTKGRFSFCQSLSDDVIKAMNYKVAPYQFFFHPDDLAKIKEYITRHSQVAPGKNTEGVEGKANQVPGAQQSK